MGVSEFLQTIKARVDELAILGAAVDDEDLLEKILEGLGEDYKELVRVVQARDTPISFDELHEKLLNFEASLQNTSIKTSIPCTLIMVVNTLFSLTFLLFMVSLISLLHLTPPNTMASLSGAISTLLKQVSPFSLMLLFLCLIGLMPLPQPFT